MSFGTQFAINTNTRSSDRLERLDMIKTVADQVVKLDHGHKVDLEHPERTILIELYKVWPNGFIQRSSANK